MPDMHVIVIGAGVLGTTTAWYLREAGFDVEVVERADEPAAETSHANGSLLHVSHAEPWNSPDALRQTLQWLGRTDAPMRLRWSRIPALLPWGLGFLRHSHAAMFADRTRANARLALYSLEQYRALADCLGLQCSSRSASGVIKVFFDNQSLARAVSRLDLTRELGVNYVVLDVGQAIAREPALAGVADRLVGAIAYPDDETADARLFTHALAARAAGAGVAFRFGTEVRKLLLRERRIVGVETSAGLLQGDAYVLAAGSFSVALARQVGVHLPLAPVKGYSCTVPIEHWPEPPCMGVIDDARKIVIANLGDRLRIAGTAEFAGYDRRLPLKRIDALLQHAGASFPQLHVQAADCQPWYGLRPMSVDGTPIIGPSPVDNLSLVVGPGHLGWTFACGMARMLTEHLQGGPVDPDYRLARFRSGRSRARPALLSRFDRRSPDTHAS